MLRLAKITTIHAAPHAIRLAIAAIALVTTLTSRSAHAAVELHPVTFALAPVFVTHAGDLRLFIVEQAGKIRIFDRQTTTMLATPFLDIRTLVASGGERGLLSMAFHPDYATNGFFYINYTNLGGDTVIARYQVGANRNVADASSAAILLTIDQPFANHNGGQVQIGHDHHLYIGMGDGGSANDPQCNAQRKDSMLGKMLRLDIRQNLSVAPYYGIPDDNPFTGANDPSGEIPDEVWAFGLRNPWRFSFDRANGDLFIADVGQNNYEEIDWQPHGTAGGRNFGWKVMEGFHCASTTACPASTPPCKSPALTLPIHEYNHASGDCSITGGYVYRGTRAAELKGKYVFADYCSGAIRTLEEIAPNTWQAENVLVAGGQVTSFGEGANGELYVAVNNSIFEIVGEPSSVPVLPWAGLSALAVGLLWIVRRSQADRLLTSHATAWPP